jgi:streptogramin lyase
VTNSAWSGGHVVAAGTVRTAACRWAHGTDLVRGLPPVPSGLSWQVITEIVVDRVGSFNPANHQVTEFPVGVDAEPAEIARAPDGSLWFTQSFAGNIARITTDGVVTAESKVVKGSEPRGITVASDGNPWYTDNPGGRVAVLMLR